MSKGIVCGACGSGQVVVKDTRPTTDMIRRRRRCLDCGHRFTTFEKTSEGGAAPADIMQIARSALLEAEILHRRLVNLEHILEHRK